MKQLFTFPAEELNHEDTIYVSIALELHDARTTNEADRIEFSNLLNDAEKRLKESDLKEKESLLKQLDVVRLNKNELANHTSGLVVYVTAKNIYYYDLGVSVEKKLVIDERPYVLPVVENFQFEQDYHLLLITRENARIYEGHGTNITELNMIEIDEEAPVDLDTALGTERTGGQLNFGTYGSGAGAPASFHGHNETSQEKDIDRENYFRLVDRFIYDNYSLDSQWPLIVYTVEENQAVFRSVSNNKYLSDFKILGSTANMKENDIKKTVAQEINNLIGQEKREALQELAEVRPANRIENIPDDLASASLRGQIHTLYLKKGLEIPGTLTEEGTYNREDDRNNFVELLVDKVINTDASVYIFASDDMPEDQKIIARLRF